MDWAWDWPDGCVIPETVYNGDECRSPIVGGDPAFRDGQQVIARDSKGEIIGIGRLDIGGVAGLDSDGV